MFYCILQAVSYFGIFKNDKNKNMNATPEVKITPAIDVAYISYQGKMDLVSPIFDELIGWAAPKGLMNQPDLKMITIYHDSAKTTDLDKIRMSICMTVNPQNIEAQLTERVHHKTIPSIKCIVTRFEIGFHEFQKSWEDSFGWMFAQGHKKSTENDPFEIYHNNPHEHPQGISIVDICIPIQ